MYELEEKKMKAAAVEIDASWREIIVVADPNDFEEEVCRVFFLNFFFAEKKLKSFCESKSFYIFSIFFFIEGFEKKCGGIAT